ncbi:MAG: type II secretion system protein GspN [Desulfuromonadaceae bacterium]|nr:type II secretion system protein GspN [Desulfuromonadaceae bacterium]MDD2849834.1 type II secretion system protein GspN [Desulfuromonadaceae bacterium]MDD4131605.1 type II secretion system protein GspN [Desulfuromonadaceae bacterium]
MKGARLVRVSALIATGLVLFLLFCYLLFPTGRIDSVLAQALSQQGLTLSPTVHKTLLPGLAWDDMLLSSEQGPLLRCRRLQVRALLLPLFVGRAVLSGEATIGKGQLDINYALNGKDAMDIDSEGISLADIPFIKSVMGAQAGGNVWLHGTLQRGPKGLSGDLKLEIKQLEFSGVRLGAFSLPDAANLKTQGMVRVRDGKARLESFTIEGDGIYMRLSGDIPSDANAAVTPLNMSLEIMPKPDFLEKQKLVFMLLAKFMASPGVYKVPIRGTLLKPQIM